MRTSVFLAALVAAAHASQWCVSENEVPSASAFYRGTYKDFALYAGGPSVAGCVPIAPYTSGNDGLWLLQFEEERRMADVIAHLAKAPGVSLVHKTPRSIVVSGGDVVPAQLSLDACGTERGMDIMPLPTHVVTKPKQMSARLLASSKKPRSEQIQAIVDMVSQAQIVGGIHFLEEIYTRNSYSDQLYRGVDWVEARYRDYNMTTERIPFRADMAPNVVATLPGVTSPSVVVVVGAHLDSRNTNTNDATNPAPGADDNASGTVALLEIARLIFQNNLQFDYTLKFCAFTGEEQGLLGSAHLAQLWKGQGMDIEVMFNADMLGWTLPGQPINVGFKDASVDLPLTAKIRDMIPQYVAGVGTAMSASCCSDYLSFNREGYSAVGFFENGGAASNYPHYHTETDLEMYLNTEQLRTHTQAMLAAVLTYTGLLPARAARAPAAKKAYRVANGGDIMPTRATYVYITPVDVAGSAVVPNANVSVIAVYDRTDAQAGWKPVDINADLPKYLVRSRHAEDRVNLKKAYGKNLVPITEEYYIQATGEVGERKAHSCGNVMLIPGAGMRKRSEMTLPVVSAKAQDKKDEYMAKVTSPNCESVLRGMSGDQPIMVNDQPLTLRTRYSFVPDNLYAAEWMAEWMLDNAGCDDIIFQSFIVTSWGITRNVICVKLGSQHPEEIVVLGAHFDSISSANGGDSAAYAPGAVDNGSGATSVMMVAQALRDFQPKRTIHYVMFSGEEQGLYGSTHYVSVAQQEGRDIKAALIMDMTAYSNNYFGVTFEGTQDAAIVLLMANAVENLEYLKRTLGSQLEFQLAHNSFGSDHVPFQRAGIPAILLIEKDDTDYPGYHRTTDTVAYANWDQMRDIARVILGQVVDYSA
ncbi:hypothetical protein DIPPA_01842 [Diplonema papillatum]|nr:hypothetical protein DIPPA_01842 [Diplonema papillatum]